MFPKVDKLGKFIYKFLFEKCHVQKILKYIACIPENFPSTLDSYVRHIFPQKRNNRLEDDNLERPNL